jgi:hypothetical protein
VTRRVARGSRGLRRGVGLVEVLVASALATGVLVAAFAALGLGERSRGATAFARSLATAASIEEHLRSDLARLVMVVPSPLKVVAKPARLAFYVAEPAAGRTLPVRGVVYALPAPGMLTRESGGAAAPVGTAPLDAIAFHPFLSATGPLLRVVLTVGRDPADPAGRPLTHTFLARLATPRVREVLELDVRWPLPAADRPDAVLPVIGSGL